MTVGNAVPSSRRGQWRAHFIVGNNVIVDLLYDKYLSFINKYFSLSHEKKKKN